MLAAHDVSLNGLFKGVVCAIAAAYIKVLAPSAEKSAGRYPRHYIRAILATALLGRLLSRRFFMRERSKGGTDAWPAAPIYSTLKTGPFLRRAFSPSPPPISALSTYMPTIYCADTHAANAPDGCDLREGTLAGLALALVRDFSRNANMPISPSINIPPLITLSFIISAGALASRLDTPPKALAMDINRLTRSTDALISPR